MSTGRSLREVTEAGVELTAAEAVAVAQQIIAGPNGRASVGAPPDPPSLDTVFVHADGSADCQSCDATPTVLEIANLLEAMLPRDGAARVPGGLRYIIARGRLEVVAPPFESIAALSAALARHERGDRHAIVRDLYARAAAQRAPEQRVVETERRRTGPSTATLRRLLREADEERFALAQRFRAASAPAWNFDPVLVRPRPEAVAVGGERRQRFVAVAWVAGAAAAILIAFLSGYTAVDHVRSAGRSRLSPPTLPSRTLMPRPATMALDVPARPSSGPLVRMGVGTSGVVDNAAGRVLPAARIDPSPDTQIASPSFASEGTALFVQPGRAGADAADEADRETNGLRVMTITEDGATDSHVQPSPDGARIAFDSDRDGERGVYLANRDGTDVHRVSGQGFAALPAWSPDGTRVAFVRAEVDRPHVWNVWLRELATGESRRLTSFRSGQVWGAAWFPQGDRICFAHEDRLIVQDLNGRVLDEYASPVSHHVLRTPAVSPNGRYAIFHVNESGGWLLDFQDGSMRHVIADPTAEGFAWSQDGRRVAFHSERDGWGIWTMTAS
jgi:Tol biopolymer transport system component